MGRLDVGLEFFYARYRTGFLANRLRRELSRAVFKMTSPMLKLEKKIGRACPEQAEGSLV